MNLVSFFEKLNKLPLYLIIFFIPLLFFSYSQDILNFPKQYLFLILVFLSLWGWLGKASAEKKVLIRGEKKFYLILFLILISSLASLLTSPSFYLSFWGHFLDISDSFLTIFLFLIFVFLLINSFEKKSEFLSLVFLLSLSGSLSGLFNLLQIYKIFILPFDFSKNVSFNTIGTPSAMLLFQVFLFPLTLMLFIRGKGLFKILSGIILFIVFANIVLTNFKIGWIVLMLELFLLFVFLWGREGIKISFFALLMVVMISAIFFYIFPLRLAGFPVLPPEFSLKLPSEIQILKGVLSENWKKMVFGSGPGTFVFEYSLYRPLLLNQSLFWGTRFLKGNSSFFDWFITKGLLGGLVLLFFIILNIFFVFKYVARKEKEEFFDIKTALISGLFASLFTIFIYPFNFTLFFVFWFFIASSYFFICSKTIAIDFSSSVKSLIINFLFVSIFILGFVLIFFGSQRIIAEFEYIKGIKNSQSNNLDQTIGFIKKAVELNPHSDIYWRDLSQIYLTKAILISQSTNIPLEEKRISITKTIVDGGDAINKAVEIAPFNVANWNVKGYFYQNLIGIEKAEGLALNSYQKAIELEPSSPYAYGEKARVYILFSQTIKENNDFKRENLEKAIENLNKAIQLKPDYGPARYLLAVAFDQLGKEEEAILKLEETKLVAPNDWGVAFQLGLLYWRKAEIEKAQTEFERAVNLRSDYANARYMLGLIYDKKGEKEKAIKEFEEVKKLDPENSQVKKILENLQNGLPAVEGELPFQENPPEIKK